MNVENKERPCELKAFRTYAFRKLGLAQRRAVTAPQSAVLERFHAPPGALLAWARPEVGRRRLGRGLGRGGERAAGGDSAEHAENVGHPS